MSMAVIFGASGDIGGAIAQRLAKAGWSLYLHYAHNQTKVDALQRDLATHYPKQDFVTVAYDFTQPSEAKAFAAQLVGIDAVVFAQGQTYYHLFADSTAAELQALMQVHLLTPMLLLTSLQRTLARSGHGRIVLIGSVYGASGSAMEVGYSTVKGAQSAFVHAYAQEVASLGITVNVVAPGAVDTQMNAMFDPETLAAVKEEIPAARLAQPADVSYYVNMLLQADASYLTGQTLYVTGGWLA